MLSVFVLFVLKDLLYCYLLAGMLVYAKVHYPESTLTSYTFHLIFGCRRFLSLGAGNRKGLFYWRLVGFSFDLFVWDSFGRVCNFVYFFGLKTVFVYVFGVDVDESRLSADSFCLFGFFVQVVGERFIHLGDDSAMVVFIRDASFVTIHLLFKILYIIRPPYYHPNHHFTMSFKACYYTIQIESYSKINTTLGQLFIFPP